jgi:hypothetical protein
VVLLIRAVPVLPRLTSLRAMLLDLVGDGATIIGGKSRAGASLPTPSRNRTPPCIRTMAHGRARCSSAASMTVHGVATGSSPAGHAPA